jgi:large subunit ribosomal protein L4
MLSLLDEKFNEITKYNPGTSLAEEKESLSAVHQVVVGLLANKRNVVACTKNKALVTGGGKKPFKQKGSGRARQGSTRSPLMPGGGTIFGPNANRNFSVKVNKKQRKRALLTVILDRMKAGNLKVIEKFPMFEKTKDVKSFLDIASIKNSLIVPSENVEKVLRCSRNLPTVMAVSCEYLNSYDVLKYEHMVVEKSAMDKILKRCAQ